MRSLEWSLETMLLGRDYEMTEKDDCVKKMLSEAAREAAEESNTHDSLTLGFSSCKELLLSQPRSARCTTCQSRK